MNVRAGHCMYAPWPPSIVFSPTPKRTSVHEGCCHIEPRPWAPSLSVLQLKSAGASVIACTTRGSSACLLCNSKEYLECMQVIVTACTTRGLCFPVLQLKALSSTVKASAKLAVSVVRLSLRVHEKNIAEM